MVGIEYYVYLKSAPPSAPPLLYQVVMTLAVAEEACEFEHRDLHWGNLLISRGVAQYASFRLR
jgi:serine/threonine-protein kinase haspin